MFRVWLQSVRHCSGPWTNRYGRGIGHWLIQLRHIITRVGKSSGVCWIDLNNPYDRILAPTQASLHRKVCKIRQL